MVNLFKKILFLLKLINNTSRVLIRLQWRTLSLYQGQLRYPKMNTVDRLGLVGIQIIKRNYIYIYNMILTKKVENFPIFIDKKKKTAATQTQR